MRHHIEAALGEPGRRWLAELPAAIAEACARWSLAPRDPYPDLSYGWVAPVERSDGSEAVLKLGWPDPEARTGIEALRCFDGRGAVRLLDSDPARAWLLLERLQPGQSLAHCDDATAARHWASVVGALHRAPPEDHDFPTLRDWWRRGGEIRRGSFPRDPRLPARLLEWAEEAFRSLDDGAVCRVLLHGDLHHRNVLSAARAPWLAIDPKGVVGDPAFEPGAFLRNPIPELEGVPDLEARLDRRLEVLAEETGLDLERMAAWGAVGAVLSATWDLTAGGAHVDHAVACARHLAGVADPGVAFDR
ncbi:MAG: aminoglycoside phosphotransferase family protein [Myxococcota bacterium]